MPILRSGADRCVLRPGKNTLGGRGTEALPVTALAWQPPVATITVPEHGPVLIQRITAAVVVRLDDQPLGVAPAELRHGAHIDLVGCRLTYEADVPAGAPAESNGTVPIGATPVPRSPATPTAVAELSGATVTNLRTGQEYALPNRRVVIGRDTDCDVVVPDKGVSRRHASITPVPGGYLLTDESSNGTLVNGVRVGGSRILDSGDVLRMHEVELRFDVAGAERTAEEPEGASSSRAATAILDLSNLRSVVASEKARASGRRSPTATLEIIRGPFVGASFHIERPVCAIGRGDQSDVRLRDDSVSTTHATLLRKGETWYVIDLRSVNGTFVDGYRVAGERELPTGATLRVGAVEMIFRAFVGGVEEPLPQRERTGLFRMLYRLFRPPVDGDV